MNIPIYRAKKIDSDVYITGYLYKNGDFVTVHNIRIDPTTLAINLPDMTDSQGNRIFASLSNDGKGGDCTFMQNGYNETFMWDNLNACVVLKSRNYEAKCFKRGCRNESTLKDYTIVGIQQ